MASEETKIIKIGDLNASDGSAQYRVHHLLCNASDKKPSENPKGIWVNVPNMQHRPKKSGEWKSRTQGGDGGGPAGGDSSERGGDRDEKQDKGPRPGKTGARGRGAR